MNKLHSSLLGGLVVLATATSAFAIEPPPSVPPGKPAPTGKTAAKTPASAAKAAATNPPAPAPAPAASPAPPAAPASKLDNYIVELVAVVNLSDPEKKQVEDLYAADGAALQKILNDDSLSPLQQAQQVSDLRDVRNTKIESILHDLDRQQAFLQVEAVYRVSLTESAAEGGLVPPAPATPPPAPAPPTPAAPKAAPAPASKPAQDASAPSPFPPPGQ